MRISSFWLINARLIYKEREITRTLKVPGLSGRCPEPQDIYKRFEEAPVISRKDIRKGRGLNLSPFKPLRSSASLPVP